MRTLAALVLALAAATLPAPALTAAALAAPALAAPTQVRTPHVQAALVAETQAAAPGSILYVALRQKIAPGWHTYWRNPGDAGQPTSLTWSLPAGWTAGEIVWPAPERFLAGPIMNYVYTDSVLLPVPIQVPATAKADRTVALTADVAWLVCKDICIPEQGRVSIDLPVTAATPAPSSDGPAIQSTLAAAPKPAGLQARFTTARGAVQLSVVGAAATGADVAHAYFYPYDGTVLEQAKPQLAARGPRGLTLTLPAGYAFSHGAPPKQLQGVLSLGDRAFEVNATRGAPLAGAAGSTAPVASTPGPSGAPGNGAHGDAGRAGSAGGGLSLLAALALAFGGGLILNLMPCVFPILSMKAAALARHLQSPAHAQAEGVAFLAGVLLTFLSLAALLIAARAGGQAVGWGFQLQSPLVVGVLALVVLASALNLSGVFEIGLSAQGVGTQTAARGDWIGALFTGVLAVVVAAPCTAPLMAPAIGWALVQPPLPALTVFVALGLGLAAPFTLVSFVPALFGRLPRPGAWMEGLRQVLAFPMYAAAAWLAWVFAVQTSAALGLPLLFAAALLTAFAAFCWGVGQRSGHRVAAGAMAITCTAGALAALFVAPAAPASAAAGAVAGAASAKALAIQPWSPRKVAELQAAGKPVFVDFTAAWCVTCQVNERTALATRQVADAFARTGGVYLKADWTRRDAAIAQALTAQGRSGVPLYLVYGRAAAPTILPQILTPGAVAAALDAAARN